MLKLKEIIKNLNLFRKIGSVIVAIIVYIIIYNIYDPEITIKINNVQVQLENEDNLISQKKVYKITKNEKIDIYVKGKQSLIKGLKSEDINAIANLENLSIMNSVPINVNIPKLENEEIEIEFDQNNSLMLKIDDYVSKNFILEIIKENELPDNYYLYKDNCYRSIKISGPKEKIKQIEKVGIIVDLKELKPNYNKKLEIKLFDSFSNEINQDDLELDLKEFNYQPTIYTLKKVPLNINFVGNIPFGYNLNSSNYNPKEIIIASSENNLKKYSELNINYDISNLTESKKISLDLSNYIPNGIILAQDNLKINIDMIINKLILKEYEISTQELLIKNSSKDYIYNFIDDKNIVLTLMGDETIINNLSIEEITPYISIEENKIGTYVLPIKINDELDVTLVSNNEIKIEIIKDTKTKNKALDN